jgi:HTH-type transcriptional regulator / antitoxin HigA
MTDTMAPAEAFPPGEFLRDELAERGWAEGEFAEIIGRPVQAVSEILNGKKEITPETAVAIGAALGTSAELWVNLQATYRLHQARSAEASKIRPVERRAKLRELVPVRELQKRKWLPDTGDLDTLEAAVRDFLGISTLDDEPQLAVAARRTNVDSKFTPEQRAWVARVQNLGAQVVVAGYNPDALASLAAGLVGRIDGPADLRRLDGWLADCGVSLVVELPLRNSKMDGIVSFSTGTPVIGLTTRGDRMDGFVFTLLHEIAHLTLGHVGPGGLGVDEDLDPNSGSERERAANETAAAWIFPTPPKLPPGELTPRTLVETARAYRVHVCFLIGRLQNQGRLDWKDYRRLIPKVRPFVELG